MKADLPARVRVTRPPLPLAASLQGKAAALLPRLAGETPEALTTAIAGGGLIGVAARFENETLTAVTPPWRGKGVEGALEEALP